MTGSEEKRRVRVVAAVIEKDGKYLITQRRSAAVLPLLWEFPGGRCEGEESNQEALTREIRERLDVTIEVGHLISFVSHHYEDYIVDLYLYECKLLTERFRCAAVNDFRWVSSEEFDSIPFTPADEASMARLLGEQS